MRIFFQMIRGRRKKGLKGTHLNNLSPKVQLELSVPCKKTLISKALLITGNSIQQFTNWD